MKTWLKTREHNIIPLLLLTALCVKAGPPLITSTLKPFLPRAREKPYSPKSWFGLSPQAGQHWCDQFGIWFRWIPAGKTNLKEWPKLNLNIKKGFWLAQGEFSVKDLVMSCPEVANRSSRAHWTIQSNIADVKELVTLINSKTTKGSYRLPTLAELVYASCSGTVKLPAVDPRDPKYGPDSYYRVRSPEYHPTTKWNLRHLNEDSYEWCRNTSEPLGSAYDYVAFGPSDTTGPKKSDSYYTKIALSNFGAAFRLVYEPHELQASAVNEDS